MTEPGPGCSGRRCARAGPGCLPDRRAQPAGKHHDWPPICKRLGQGILPLIRHGPDVFADWLGGFRAEIGADPDVVGRAVAGPFFLSPRRRGVNGLSPTSTSAQALPPLSSSKTPARPCSANAPVRPSSLAPAFQNPALLFAGIASPRTHRGSPQPARPARSVRFLHSRARTAFDAEAVATRFRRSGSACWLRCCTKACRIAATLPPFVSRHASGAPCSARRGRPKVVAGNEAANSPAPAQPFQPSLSAMALISAP